MVILVVAGVLCALAFPAYKAVSDRSKIATCLANLRKIGQGMSQYADEHNNWLPPHLETVTLPGGKRVYPKWNAWIAPYITGWDGSDPVETPMDRVFYCPANPKPYDPELTYYSGVGKSDYSYGYNSRFLTSQKVNTFVNQLPMRRTSVPLKSKLVLVTDIPNAVSGVRREPGLRELRDGWLHPSALTIATWHSGGSNILFLDGHVELRRATDILGSNYDAGNWTPYVH